MSLNKLMENDMAGLQVEEEIETNGEGIITHFNPDHIITNSGLCLTITTSSEPF
jgi:hypothetical protein